MSAEEQPKSAPPTKIEGVDDATVAALTAVFSVFDKEEEVTAEELKKAFGAIKVELSDEQIAGMQAVVEGEKKKSREERVLAPDALQSWPAPGASDVVRRRAKEQQELLKTPEGDAVTTSWEAFQHGVKHNADRPCLGVRKGDAYEWQTYKEVDAKVRAYGAGLKALTGVSRGDLVGINLKTQDNWTVAHLAHGAFAICTVTLYDTYGAEALKFIVNQTELKVIVAGAPQLATLCEILPECPSVEHLILAGPGAAVDELEDATKAILSDNNRQLHNFEDVVKAGEGNVEVDAPKQDDLCFICYTSGTTGMPKGVQHMHSSIVASMAAGREVIHTNNQDVHIAFLPLAHIMELWLEAQFLFNGVAIGYYGGDVRQLMSDIAILKPTLFVAVPRLLNRIYNGIVAGTKGKTGVPALLTQLALASKKKAFVKDGRIKSYWDWIVFDKIRAILGGRVRLMATGSAPIAPEVLGLFAIGFSARVQEGYGASEVLVTNITLPTDQVPGSVGPPFSSTEIRLVDVPEMDYLTTDQPCPRGEVQMRGPTVMVGYFKNPEKTKEALSEDGWYSTGDIGQWRPNGTLQIIDRKKSIFKLSQGEYCAPNKIENVYVRSPFIAQAFVHGESLRPNLVAVVVPDPEYLPKWAAAKGLEGEAASLPALLQNKELKEAILDSIKQEATSAKLPKYEIVTNVHIHPEAFSVENNLMTPTFKLKRYAARNFFSKEIEAMYAAS